MPALCNSVVATQPSPLAVLWLPAILSLLVLMQSVQMGSATCSATYLAREVNESNPANHTIEVLDASYQLTATPGLDPVYACYFGILNTSLILTKTFDMENFTSCVDGRTVTATSIPPVLSITIPCSSSGVTGTFLTRLVDVNEFPPLFVPNRFSVNVSEAVTVGTQVIQLKDFVIDEDKSRQTTFNMLIVSGSQGDFAMNDGVTSGIIRIQRALDYDFGTRLYTMNISASDLITESASRPVPLTGYATLMVHIQDSDDRNPSFTKNTYSFYFMENDTSYINRTMFTNPPLEALDGDVGINQTINYAIDFGSLLGNVSFLSINVSTGQLTVLTIVDREALPSTTMLVQVRGYQTDKPDTRVALTVVSVIIGDKNDNSPVMDSALYNVSIAENSIAGSYATTVRATDADFGENATFVFKYSDPSGAFQVNPTSGHVTVVNPSLLDRETQATFVMTVWAEESVTPEKFASPQSQLVINLVDVNDNSPLFSPPNASYAFAVSVTVSAGFPVGAVSATDADAGSNGVVRFSIAWAGGGSGALFQLDPITGALTTRVSLASGASLGGGVFVLQVVAEDQALPLSTRRQSRAIVEITVSPVPTTEAPSTTATTTAATTTTSSIISSSTSAQAVATNAATLSTSSTITSIPTTSAPATTSTAPANSTTTAAADPPPVASAGVQIALMVICGILLLIIIGLIVLVIVCWRHKQPQFPESADAKIPNEVNGGHPGPANVEPPPAQDQPAAVPGPVGHTSSTAPDAMQLAQMAPQNNGNETAALARIEM